MSYVVIERMPYAQITLNSDGVPREFSNIKDAIKEASDCQDAIVVSFSYDVRVFVALLSDARFLIEQAAMKGIPDKLGVKDRIDSFMEYYERE